MSVAVVPAAYVFLYREGPAGTEVLLQLRRNTGFRDGYWAAGAAGHVEAGESVIAAARRELREELGVTVDAADLEPLTAMHRTGATGLAIDERVDFFFACQSWRGDPQPMEPAKSGGLRWIRLTEAADPAHPVVPHELAVLQAWAGGVPPAVMTWGFA